MNPKSGNRLSDKTMLDHQAVIPARGRPGMTLQIDYIRDFGSNRSKIIAI
jgi:hypothetical protein